MNTSMIKTFLCLYAVGLSGYNNMNDAHHIQRGQGSRKPGPSRGRGRGLTSIQTEPRGAEALPSVIQAPASSVCQEMMSNSLQLMKESAERDEKAYEDSKAEIKEAEEDTASLKKTAEESRKAYNDSLEYRRQQGLLSGNTEYHAMLAESLNNLKESAERDEKAYEDSKAEIKEAEEDTAGLKKTAEESRKAYNDSLEYRRQQRLLERGKGDGDGQRRK